MRDERKRYFLKKFKGCHCHIKRVVLGGFFFFFQMSEVLLKKKKKLFLLKTHNSTTPMIINFGIVFRNQEHNEIIKF